MLAEGVSNQAGYDPDPADGVMGRKTRAARTVLEVRVRLFDRLRGAADPFRIGEVVPGEVEIIRANMKTAVQRPPLS